MYDFQFKMKYGNSIVAIHFCVAVFHLNERETPNNLSSTDAATTKKL